MPWNITEYPLIKTVKALAGAKIPADIAISYVRAMTGRAVEERTLGTFTQLQTVSKPSFGQNRDKPTSHPAAANHSVLNI